jgi:hypothetical protein
LNALENIRSSINVAERGRTMGSEADAHDLARLAYAETADAIKVLSEGALVKNIEPGILSARANAIAAGVLLQVAQYTPRVAIDNVLQQATSRLRAARSDLADKTTLPASFQN